ncbi:MULTISPECIES: hypothetical protein [Rheinheimera]|uniref:Rod shape-determining protein MreD n=1 Tax=Rheinheimera marina TaxID=1774958 RepID=A0ABV9JL79_9GAMM
MLLFFLPRYLALSIVVLLGVALLHAVQPVRLGFVADVLAPPLLCLWLVRWYQGQHPPLQLSDRPRLTYGLAMLDALLQAALVFISVGSMQAIALSDAVLSFFSVVVFHTLMIYFALGYTISKGAVTPASKAA